MAHYAPNALDQQNIFPWRLASDEYSQDNHLTFEMVNFIIPWYLLRFFIQ